MHIWLYMADLSLDNPILLKLVLPGLSRREIGKLLSLKSRVLGHECFDWLFVYLVLIPVSCFVVLFSVLFRFQLSVLRPNRSPSCSNTAPLYFCVLVLLRTRELLKPKSPFRFFKTYLVRRRTKTQKYKGAVFEQLGERLGLSTLSWKRNKTENKTTKQDTGIKTR